MIDDKFVEKFNSNSPQRPYTKEQIQALFDNMPNQRIGMLFDFSRWIKKILQHRV